MIARAEALGLVFSGVMGLVLASLSDGLCAWPDNEVLGALFGVWLSLMIWE